MDAPEHGKFFAVGNLLLLQSSVFLLGSLALTTLHTAVARGQNEAEKNGRANVDEDQDSFDVKFIFWERLELWEEVWYRLWTWFRLNWLYGCFWLWRWVRCRIWSRLRLDWVCISVISILINWVCVVLVVHWVCSRFRVILYRCRFGLSWICVWVRVNRVRCRIWVNRIGRRIWVNRVRRWVRVYRIRSRIWVNWIRCPICAELSENIWCTCL